MLLRKTRVRIAFLAFKAAGFSVGAGVGAGAGAGAAIRGRAIGVFPGCFSVYPIMLPAFIPSSFSPAKFDPEDVNTFHITRHGRGTNPQNTKNIHNIKANVKVSHLPVSLTVCDQIELRIL